MSERWRELEATAERMKRLAENTNIPYSERQQLRRDAEKIAAEARKQRRAYVNWLWGY